MKKTFFLFTFLLASTYSNAQFLVSKPYLKVTNKLSGKVYKIKPNKKIEFKLNNDSILIKDRIEYFLDAKYIVFEKTEPASLEQISYIKFQPKSKGLRIAKIMYYAFWCSAIGFATYENTNPTNDPNFEQLPIFPFFILGTAFVLATAEIGESILNLSVQKHELFKNKSLKLEIISK